MLKEKQIYGSCFGKVWRVKSNSLFLGQSDKKPPRFNEHLKIFRFNKVFKSSNDPIK